ncbi:MAG: TonB-dependent receptor [Acidobacteria bacterium]|nr:TonB-dependent receptor [Acidobacteriota bacterium]
MLLSFMLLSVAAFGQSIGGTVRDSSQAVLPGAEVTARNDGTGIENRTTVNNSGVYNFPSLPTGTYTVTVDAPGFQRVIRTEVRLGVGSQLNLPFELAVAGTVTEVEVTSTVETMILEAGSSTGTVLQEETLSQLPLVANDAMEMINLMGGVVKMENPTFSGDQQMFAGVTGNNINISRDGITVNEIRFNSGITSPARLNPEMVGEFKMVLSPVDAEMGRGAGQVQMTTRSGTNSFRGSGVWNIQNSFLDAYDYSAKHMPPQNIQPRAWRNLQNYTVSLSGPIIRNRTFFFVTWDQAIARNRSRQTPSVLTDCARKGIYRYLSNTINGNAGIVLPTLVNNFNPGGGSSMQRPVVNLDGTPRYEYQMPDDPSAYPGFSGQLLREELRFQSVLGPLSQTAMNQVAADPINCSQYLPSFGPNDLIPTNTNFGVDGSWDNYRKDYDQSGFVSRFTALMPKANYYQVGDGLNLAGHEWTRRGRGATTIFGGNNYDDNRKAITFKIDHNINAEHRISGTYSYESNYGDDGERLWPEEYKAYGGLIHRKPQTFTVTLTSTLSPTLLNELRIGMSRTSTMTYDALSNPETGDKLSQVLIELLQSDNSSKFPRYANFPILAAPGAGSGVFGTMFHPEGGLNSQPYGARGNLSTTWGGYDPRWTYSDTITWMKGAHAFKSGVEFRDQQSYQKSNGIASFSNGANAFPSVKGGVMEAFSPYTSYAFTNEYWPDMPRGAQDYVQAVGAARGYASSNNFSGMYNLMTYMTGSIGNIAQYSFALDAMNPRWNDHAAGEFTQIADLRQREFAAFFKDDWKITNDLTLNLGVRYEYYGVPWDANGRTAGVYNGLTGAMGVTGGDLGTWMPPLSQIQAGYSGDLTRQVFIGPKSPNSDLLLYEKDMNNFGPHVGFAWQLPWFGRGLTTLRGGYSISYSKIANFDNTFGYSAVMSNTSGITYPYIYFGHSGNETLNQGCIPGQSYGTCYLNFDNFGQLLPLYNKQDGFIGFDKDNQPQVMGEQPIVKRDQSLQLYDPNIRSPYIQNLTMSLTRQVGRNVTVDVRYIGTLTRKGVDSAGMGLNLNTVNLINSGLMAELIKVRQGGQSEVLNSYIKPGTLVAPSYTNPQPQTGSDQIRGSQATNLAMGNLQAVVGALATANFANLACDPAGVVVAPNAADSYCQPEYAYINPTGQRGTVLREGGVPENLIYANPQFSAVYLKRNQMHTNYHSMQAQVTMRPVHGVNFQATYTWSRNLSRAGITDYRDWTGNYWLNGQHRSHQLNVNGAWTLPFGPNGFVLRNATGGLKKTVEGWQVGWIASVVSGMPMSLTGSSTLWGNTGVNKVGPFDNKSGKVDWNYDLEYGFFYGMNKYTRIIDPQCLDRDYVASGLEASCVNSGLRALVEIDDSKPVAGYQTRTQAGALEGPVRGTIIFQNPLPGQAGNYRGNVLTGMGRWTLDANMGKTIEFMEGKRIEIRVDAQNIFNHAIPSESGGSVGTRNNAVTNPNVTINTTGTIPWGRVNTKTGHRTFQGRVRLSF